MMFHLRDEDLVSFAKKPPAPAVRHEVDRLRRAPVEHDRAGVGCAEEPSNLCPRSLEQLGRLLAEHVDGSVGVSVVVPVEVDDRIDHLLGSLRGVRAVEIDERLAVHGPLEDREVGPNPLDVESRRMLFGEGHVFHSYSAAAPTVSSRPSSLRTPSYPLASSSAASSALPSFTIRPAIITWTKSGVM